ncbi:MAG: hypothetical protein WCO94_10610 [Verrucomicrobiota bacterium]|jgi:hypothetical protein
MSKKLLQPSDGGNCGGCVACLDAPCDLTLVHVDMNRCEDDIFGIYIVRSNGSERFIRQIDLVSTPAGCCGSDYETGEECPETRIEVPITIEEADLDACCKFTIALRLEGTNCCNTYTQFSINGPGGEVFSQSFGQEGLTQSFDIRDLCNPAP